MHALRAEVNAAEDLGRAALIVAAPDSRPPAAIGL